MLIIYSILRCLYFQIIENNNVDIVTADQEILKNINELIKKNINNENKESKTDMDLDK